MTDHHDRYKQALQGHQRASRDTYFIITAFAILIALAGLYGGAVAMDRVNQAYAMERV